MSQPQVVITELDGALGASPTGAGKLLALAGPATAGQLLTPATFGRVKDAIAALQSGPLLEAAAHAIDRYQKPVVCVRTNASNAGALGTVAKTGTGTAAPSATGTPVDDLEIALKVITGGTVGTSGIVIQSSADGGRNWSPQVSLGTATSYLVPGTGVTIALGTGTYVAGDRIDVRASAPSFSAADLGAGLDALAASSLNWEILQPVGPIDSNAFDTLELKFAALAAAGKYRAWSGGTRMPAAGETEATYLSALNTIFSAKASLYGELTAGACKLTSSVTGRKYRRPASFVVAAREASVSEEIDIADVNLGPLAGVSIRDANGNPDEHDESLNPGLDDARFTTLRTWEGFGGVYVNRPRIFSPAGSDFYLMPHRRVLNLAHAALRLYFIRRLSRPILVSKTTGYILEEEALEIESGATAILRGELLAKPKASGVQFALSRTDNLLSTKTLNGDARVIPLAYPEFINLSVGFYNPALVLQAA